MKKNNLTDTNWYRKKCIAKLILTMKLTFLFTVINIMVVSATGFTQPTKLTLNLKDATLKEVISQIEGQSSYSFLYKADVINFNEKVNIETSNTSIEKVLNNLFSEKNIQYKIIDNSLIVLLPSAAQQTKITGKVTDASNGETLPGVNVIVEGTTVGTITDGNGQYSLDVPNANSNLIFSFIGYTTETEAIKGRQVIDIALVPDIKKLDEVVVVGYGVQKKKLVTGATVQVSGENLQRLSTTSALTALTSQSPGVSILPVSGQPGDGFKVNIRGLGTTGNANPLYVIDGVAGGDINGLNPSDIESLDVLKDAASAAIYGARAANGVVLVTTKKGKSGKVQISYDGYYGIQNVYKMPPTLNAKEYMAMQDEINLNDNKALFDWKSILGPYYDDVQSGKWQGTNWLNKIRVVDAPTQNHSLNMAGGNEVSKYSMGVSYTSTDGIFGKPVESQYERTTVRLNSDHVILKGNGFDAIKFEENINYNYVVKNGIAVGNQYSNDVFSCIKAIPLMPNYNEAGKYFNFADQTAMGLTNLTPAYSNPIADMVYNNGQNISKNHNLNMSANLQLQPIKNLVFKSQFGYNMSASSYRAFQPAYDALSSTDSRKVSKVTQNMGSGWKYTWENTLNYKFNLNNSHFDALIGQSMEKWGMGENLQVSNTHLLFLDFDHAYIQNTQDVAAGSTTVKQADTDGNGAWGPGAIASFFGRINYDLNETYMVSLVMRADGSSNFTRGKRWGYFPSLSAGWVLSNENFMKSSLSFIDFLKLRGSWGQNGNCNISNFQYLAAVAFDATAAYSFANSKDVQTTGGYASIIANPDVTWEKSDQLDFGFDSRFFKSRMSVTLDWYKKVTKDWLVVAPILASKGTGAPTTNGAPYINGGDVENRGCELGLGWNDHLGKDFTFGVNVNMAYNKNKVTRIANAEGIIEGPKNVLSQGTSPMFRAEVGYPIGFFYGFKTSGVFQDQADIEAWKAAGNGILQANVQPGDLKFTDRNHDGIINDKDKGEIGDPHPDYTLGVGLNFGYKGFDLNIAAHGAFGQQIAKSYRRFVDSQYDNFTTDVFDRWHGVGTSNKMPRLTAGDNANYQNISDIYIENGNYFKIQNVTIGYDFKKLLKKLPFAQVRLFATAQNLYTFTKYSGMDPEIGSDAGTNTNATPFPWASGIDIGYYPSPRTFLLGLNLKF
jgi:TonB-dependent starch-binding outer membrane protein SusC